MTAQSNSLPHTSVQTLHHSMTIHEEEGILRRKGAGFHTPSNFALQHLFCPIWGDEYTCRSPYKVAREGLEFYSLFRIVNGYLYFLYDGTEFTAKPGDVVFIDGRKKHRYFAKEPVTFLHFNFRGNASEAYFQLLTQQGVLFHNSPEVLPMFQSIILELTQTDPNEHMLSSQIHLLLSALTNQESKKLSSAIARAQNYILSNYEKNILVDDIAAEVQLSKYHFSRQFKAETGYSPHEYLFEVRIRNARKLLAETNKSIESIAINCGFTNTSSFIRAFKKETMVTPAMFRKFFDPSGFR
ncbi:MAG: AraC family transcriptional regulator [Lachnospiraceae bacterium]|nr:AraC family transcriptional regulator [Lachnospiraceae bacterium]